MFLGCINWVKTTSINILQKLTLQTDELSCGCTVLSRRTTFICHMDKNWFRSLVTNKIKHQYNNNKPWETSILFSYVFSAWVAQMAKCYFLWNNRCLTITPTSEELNDKGQQQWNTVHVPEVHLTFLAETRTSKPRRESDYHKFLYLDNGKCHYIILLIHYV